MLSKRWLSGTATLAIAGIAAAVGTQAFAGSSGDRSVGRRRVNGLHRQFDAGPHTRRRQGPHALYLFEKDTRGRSACSGSCAAYWPPLLTHGRPTARGGAAASLLGTIRRAGGTTQVTYAGHPLYRYLPDVRPGQTTGQDSHAFGAGWYVVSPAGHKGRGASVRQALDLVLEALDADVVHRSLPVAGGDRDASGEITSPEIAEELRAIVSELAGRPAAAAA